MSNVRCNDIKPNERKLFRYLIRQIDYKGLDYVKNLEGVISTSRFLKHIRHFKESTDVSYNQIYYYLNKWSDRCILKIYDYCVCFDFEEIVKKPHYRSMVPSRVNKQFFNLYKNFANEVL